MKNNDNNDNRNTMIYGIHHVTAICSNPQKNIVNAGINDPIVSRTETENLYRLFQKTNANIMLKWRHQVTI
jgi:hypothetical protein